MRCKSCLQIFSQPSQVTKDTRTCSVCRGIKTGLKRKEVCEKTEKILLNRYINKKILKQLTRSNKNIPHNYILDVSFFSNKR